jgi:catalase
MVCPMTTPQEAVDAANERFGRHAARRALHAKGVLGKGTFTATPEAARLSRAAHLQGEPVPATVRFSNGSGDPDDPDYAQDVRGLAVKLYLPDGGKTDIVAQSAPRFPVRTPGGFVDFMRAAKPGPGQLVRMPLFLARHPEAVPGLPANIAALKPPASYATIRFYPIHAFRWVDADGGATLVRYRWVPAAGVQTISRKEAKSRGRDYLRDDIVARLEGPEPVRFVLEVQVAEPGDTGADPTTPFREDRDAITAGTLEVTELEEGRETGDDVLVFDPTRVTDGVELSDDPIVRFRTSAYSVSVERRSGRQRGEEAPSVDG